MARRSSPERATPSSRARLTSERRPPTPARRESGAGGWCGDPDRDRRPRPRQRFAGLSSFKDDRLSGGVNFSGVTDLPLRAPARKDRAREAQPEGPAARRPRPEAGSADHGADKRTRRRGQRLADDEADPAEALAVRRGAGGVPASAADGDGSSAVGASHQRPRFGARPWTQRFESCSAHPRKPCVCGAFVVLAQLGCNGPPLAGHP